jgi:hypothetical protein
MALPYSAEIYVENGRIPIILILRGNEKKRFYISCIIPDGSIGA